MGLLGATALGLVFGWFAIIVARAADGRPHPGWREAGFFAFSLLSSMAVAFAFLGAPGLTAAAIGFGLGTIAAIAALARSPHETSIREG